MGFRDTVGTIVSAVRTSNKAGFENKEDASVGAQMVEGIVAIFMAVIVILISGWLVKILWNNSMPFMFATARPVASIWTVYAFMLLIYFVV
jgi:hypothetical protein